MCPLVCEEKRSGFVLADKGGLLMAIKYKNKCFSLIARYNLQCLAVLMKLDDLHI